MNKTKTQEKYENPDIKLIMLMASKPVQEVVLIALQEQAEELFTQEDLQRIVDQHIQAQKEATLGDAIPRVKFEEVLNKIKTKLIIRKGAVNYILLGDELITFIEQALKDSNHEGERENE